MQRIKGIITKPSNTNQWPGWEENMESLAGNHVDVAVKYNEYEQCFTFRYEGYTIRTEWVTSPVKFAIKSRGYECLQK